ncbi:MAG: histidine phosphatase family protein, partial [Candidatus Latescibacteria bacterium]|nr:histidine phosphatase family protein [Candidatus Latescibacterota bacterium]
RGRKTCVKRLLIMRHAKSDWADPATEDFDRPLNCRGQTDVPILGQFLAGSAPPDLILASAARRAQETGTLLLEALDGSAELVLDGRLYLSTPDTLATVLAASAGDAGTVVVIAHNPGVEQWSSELSGASIHMPPGAVACLDCEADGWADAGRRRAALRWLITPKLLKRGLATS